MGSKHRKYTSAGRSLSLRRIPVCGHVDGPVQACSPMPILSPPRPPKAFALDGMDSDVLSRLVTKSGKLILIPYPAVTVDMGQYLSRSKEPSDLERLWVDYGTQLAREA